MTDEQKKTLMEWLGESVEPLWWCNHCKKYINGADVTYLEEHDQRTGGCGEDVEIRETRTFTT